MFKELRASIEAGDIDTVAALVVAADEQERRALADPLRTTEIARPQWVEVEWQPGDTTWGFNSAYHRSMNLHHAALKRWEGALRVAGAGCLPRASDIVAWLRSDRFRYTPEALTPGALVRVLQAPGRPSLTAVAKGLVTKLRPATVDFQWPIISALLVAADTPPPATEAVLQGWLRELRVGAEPAEVAERLRTHPWTPLLLPHVFTIQGFGVELTEQGAETLDLLSRSGGYERQALLADLLLRLNARDRPGAIKPFVTLHRLLSPTAGEGAAHREEYLGLLTGPHAGIAELAQTVLRQADEAGLLEASVAAEASWAVLARSEKKLVRAQLKWLDTVLRREPSGELFEALAVGFGNESVDLAEQALQVFAKHLPAAGESGRAVLAEAAAGLKGDLRRQVDTLLGAKPAPDASVATASADSPPGALAVPAFPPAETMPAPIASLTELATTVVTLLRHEDDPVDFERVLAALAAFGSSDRDGLVRALTPVVPGYRGSFIVNLLRAAVRLDWTAWEPKNADRPPPLHWMLVRRAQELAAQLDGDPPPALLATPATVDGFVDPGRVLALLTTAEEDGWEPGPFDLSQALLRFPRQMDPAIREGAERLVSPAGRALAGWLRDGGLPDPEFAGRTVHRWRCKHAPRGQGYYRDDCWCRAEADVRRIAVFLPDLVHPPLTVPASMFDLTFGASFDRVYGERPLAGCWPMILPGHREIAAAHLVSQLATVVDKGEDAASRLLPDLARCSGPFGTAMAICLGYGLAAARPAGRLAAVDAFLLLAARGDLDGALLGRELGELHGEGAVVLKRVAESLTEALRGGAAGPVWQVARTLVPIVLARPAPGASTRPAFGAAPAGSRPWAEPATRPAPGAGAPELLAVASAAAAVTGARDDMPGLTAVTGRGGRGRLVTEAARLLRTLSIP